MPRTIKRLLIVFTLIFLDFGVRGQINNLPPSLLTGLDISLSFSGNGNDDLRGHPAQIFGHTTFSADRFGISNSAAHFNGDLSDVIVATNLPAADTTNVTVTAWLRTSITNQVFQLLLKSHYPDSSNEQWTLYIQGSGNASPTLGFAIKRNSGGVRLQGWYLVNSSSPVPIGGTNWVFVAATWNGLEADLYANGVRIGRSTSIPPGGIDTFPTADLIVGRSPYNATPTPFIGDIDQVMVYYRALSAAELLSLYQLQRTMVTPTVPNGGLIGYYPFNGDAVDRSGFGHDGSPSSVVLATNRFGASNGAYQFNGVDSVIDLGNPPAFNFAHDFSLSLWMLAAQPEPAKFLLAKFSSNGLVGYGLASSGQSTGEAFLQDHGSLGSSFILGGPYLSDGVWHHVLATFNRTNTMTLYVDGAFVGNDTNIRNNSLPLVNSDHLLIGKATTGQAFQGLLDDVRIYDRELSAQEAAQVFAYESAFDFGQGPSGPLLPPGLTNATATAAVQGGSVTVISITDPGAGYLVAPRVTLSGGDGSGAEAVAIIQDGFVQSIIVTNPGFGYTIPPFVIIESPASKASLTISVNTILIVGSVTPGKTYILESSTNLATWSPVGASFVPVSPSITNIVQATPVTQLFRIRQLPTP